jgi:predicted transcriptional regulator
MLDTLITSKTRIKILTKFFLNSQSKAHLRGLEEEFGESSNAVRLELNRFEKASLLISKFESNRKVYQANITHPLFPDIQNILRKNLGLDHIIEEVIMKLGNIHEVWLSGSFAIGKDSQTIELILVGENINDDYLMSLKEKAEDIIKRNIVTIKRTTAEFSSYLLTSQAGNICLIWKC